MEYVKSLFEFLFPNPAYYLPVVILLVFIATLAMSLTIKRWESQRANLVVGIVILALLLIVMASDNLRRWQWIIGLIPTLMVGYQALFLWLYHPKPERRMGTGSDASQMAREGFSQEQTLIQKRREQALKRAKDTMNRHFGLKTLFIRYGFPAVLLGIMGIIILNLVVEPAKFFSLMKVVDGQVNITGPNNPGINNILLGVKFGAVGAYIYVLLELGRRTFRHDITGASAMWCLVTLVLGPVLAATVALLWQMKSPTVDNGWWGTGVVLFFAGFAPRRVIAAIEQAALQLMKVGAQPGVIETRLVPLSRIRGIGPQIEERLGEEGILDVNSLAAAEPARLIRNTSFDMKQILSWIDEAILIITLPKDWAALEGAGITGALSLVWYYDQVVDPKTGALLPPPPAITALVEKCEDKSVDNFVSTIRRLYEDPQVEYIWALYHHFTEYAGDDKSRNMNMGDQDQMDDNNFAPQRTGD